ncbi:dienelactone hydrolase family protein [Amycolatopsis aidingensis]|uniref:dienelactone hydrolase family protein n=1 Tax=Amycolatopsis aidingensis TaxID=2842453 RepID=UPI001C0C3731|nr:dienelactone hydrolase family protein [Amycolatopsis aidingensis]
MTQTHTDNHQRDDGRAVRLTYAEPEGVVRGGLVVLHEAEGVTDGVRLLVSSLAEEGWLAVAPHLYETGPADVDTLTCDGVLAATDVTLAWLVDRGISADLLGVVGFDIGGTAALVVATRRELGAAVTVGGPGISKPVSSDIPPLVEVAGTLVSPWLGIYGDTGEEIDVAEVELLREAASAASVATNVVRYPGANHRFDADPEAAAEAWERTLAWFDAHLR